MKTHIRTILAAASSVVVVTSAVAEPLKIESTFSDTTPEGKARALKLPVATVESGREAVITVAPYAFKVTATLNDDKTVKIATIIEKSNASGKSEVISRPTILTAPGKEATISVGNGAERITLKQLVTMAGPAAK
jgi:hypothetical protein